MNITEKDLHIAQKLNEHLEHVHKTLPKVEIMYLALQGSQNYELDIYTDSYFSDVDTKAIVIPPLSDIINNTPPLSLTLILPDNSHCDVKDIRIMFDTFKKQNVNFIEILFTKYYYINPFYKDEVELLRLNNENIAHYNYNQALRCMSGMSKEKLHALCHPYPSCAAEIAEIGYSKKQLSHIIRMNDFIKQYIAGKKYSECLIPQNKDDILYYKTTPIPVEEAVTLAERIDAETYEYKTTYSIPVPEDEEEKVNELVAALLLDIKAKAMKKKFIKDLKEEGEL